MATETRIIISAQDLASQTFRNVQRASGDMIKGFRDMVSLGPALRSVAGAFSVYAMAAGGKAIFDTGVQVQRLDRAFQSITGSAADTAKEFSYLRGLSDELGQNFYDLAESYKGVAAAARGTSLAGQGTRDIFRAVVEASTALSLTSEETHGALVAIGQMMSKGKVSAEELRQQLGERLPGAFQIAARAMGVTTAELDKMLVSGKLTAEEFLPKFANALSGDYANSAKAASNDAAAAVRKLSESWTDFKAALADSAFMDVAIAGLKGVTAAVKGVNDAIKTAPKPTTTSSEDYVSFDMRKRLLASASPAGLSDSALAGIFGVNIPKPAQAPLSDELRAYSTASAFTSTERRGNNPFSSGGLAELAKINQQEADKANKDFLDKARQQTKEYVDLVTFNVNQIVEQYKSEQEAIRERNAAYMEANGYVATLEKTLSLTEMQAQAAEEARAASEDMAAGWTAGMKTSTDAILSGFQFAEQSAITFRESLGQGLGEAFNQIRQKGIGSFEDIGKAALNVANVVANAWLNLLGQQASSGLMGYASGLFSGGGSTFGAEFATYMASARGNVFDPSGLVRFADGGVVTRPTMFRFSKGTGLMGEAGPEGILPLARDTRGRLGVRSSGGGTTVVVQQSNTFGAGVSRAELAASLRQVEASARAGAIAGLRQEVERGRGLN